MVSRAACGNNRRQHVAIKRTAKCACGQRQHFARIISPFAPDARSELFDLIARQLSKRARFGGFESEGAANRHGIVEERGTKRGVGEEARQSRLNVC
jgi:hypothetical protein